MRLLDLRTSPKSWALPLLGLALLGQGCSVEIDTDAGASVGETLGDGDGDADAGDGDGDGDGDSGGWEPIPARGDIELTHVVVNQGVDVPIAVQGVWVGPAERNTFVVSGRDTLMRGYWEIPDDWVPREISAVLDLKYPDGTETTITDTKMIDGPSFAGDLQRGFIFQIIADDFPPGLEYHIGLWEAGPGYEDQRESTTVIESPLDGLQLIGAQSEPAELKVVVIPVDYDNGTFCDTNTADFAQLSADEEMRFINYMHEQYPIQELVWEFRRDEPIVWNTNLTSLTQLHQPLQELRVQDNAAPNVYYYALVDLCGGGVDGAAGVAPGLATDTKAAAYLRVASGIWNHDEYSYKVMVHEVGHCHGRAHIQCDNPSEESAGNDPTYPYEGGNTGVWGFGIRLFQLHSPTATYDFMTYCHPNWVSDWGWSKAFNRIRTLTAWDYEGPSGEEEAIGEVMIGLLLKDGTEQWWTTPGGHEPDYFSSGELIHFDYGDAVIASPTNVQILDDGTTMITAAVPRPHQSKTIQGATRMVDGQVRAIDL